jgi:hypothetical protein
VSRSTGGRREGEGGSREEEGNKRGRGREKGGRREGEGREKGGRREGEGRESYLRALQKNRQILVNLFVVEIHEIDWGEAVVENTVVQEKELALLGSFLWEG